MVHRQFEYTDDKSKFFDYCLVEYSPKTEYNNKLTSANILFETFKIQNCQSDFHDSLKQIREHIGNNKVVWGLKKAGTNFAWEYYFYNYNKQDPKISASNILKIMEPYLGADIQVDENSPYFMFSIDVLKDFFNSKRLNGVHFYYTSEDRAGGLSYLLNEDGIFKENHYAFFDVKTELSQITKKIKNTIIVDFSKINLNKILLPELSDCKSICIANKLNSDCIYYCGINIDQFLFFLRKFKYPTELIDYIASNYSKLDYLQFDVGFDYNMKDKVLNISKSGFYGTF